MVAHAREQALEGRGFERLLPGGPSVRPLLEEGGAHAVELVLAHHGGAPGDGPPTVAPGDAGFNDGGLGPATDAAPGVELDQCPTCW